MFSFREVEESEGTIRDLAHAPSIQHLDLSMPRGRTLVTGHIQSPNSSPGSESSPGRPSSRRLARSPSMPPSPALDSHDESNEEEKEEETMTEPPTRGVVSFREEDLHPYRQRMENMSPQLAKIPSEEFNFDSDYFDRTEDVSDDGTSFGEQDTEAESPRGRWRWKFPILNIVADGICPARVMDNIRNPPGWSRTAAFVVRFSPCFVFSPLQTNATDRSILVRLNLICAFFCFGLMAAGSFLFLVLWWDGIADRNTDVDDGVNSGGANELIPNVWNLNGNVIANGVFAVVVFVVMLVSRPIVRNVNLVGALRYMWALLWILPIQMIFTISLFDIHGVTEVWVTQYWSSSQMSWFREKFCQPSFTSNTLCVVPEDGGPNFESEDAWCQNFFKSDRCSDIRNDAEERTERFLRTFYYVCAFWGLFFSIYLILTVKVLEGIITKPIVQASRESNVPAWLTLPIIGCLAVGILLAYSPSSVFNNETGSQADWIGKVYIAAGGLFAFAAALGWFMSVYAMLNNRDKRNKSLAALMFIFFLMLTVISMSVLFIVSIVFSINLADIPLSDAARGRTACVIDSGNSCTQCDNDEGLRECPEWTSDDVVAVQRTSLKLSATMSAIFLVYAVSALRFGFVLRKHIMMYQIAYV